MDFLTDPIFTDLGRSDFIGGIDNEALDFGQLEQFMQVAASVGAVVGEVNDSNGNVIESNAPKTETQTTLSNSATNSNRPIATVSARVSLATPTTPIATPLAANLNSSQSHLPESPPDSGSEPPYSPLQDIHGLTLTTRDSLAATNGTAIFNSLSATTGLQSHQQHALAQSAIHLSPQFTPPHSHSQPHHHQHHQSTNQHFPHHHGHSHQPQHYLNNAHHMELERGGEIRIKHEAGLIMQPSNLTPQSQAPSEAHLELATQQPQLLYSTSSAVAGFESDGVALYGGSDFQHLANTAGTLNQAAICLMNPETATPRVHVIGTATPQPQSNRSSAPSTPIHRSSTRKRKMSTTLDCADFPAGLKADPGLSMSPVQSKMNCNTPQYPFTPESQKLGPTSPVSISLPTPADCGNNSALSTASLSPALSTVNSNQDNSMDGSVAPPSTNGENTDANALTPCIRFSPFQPQNWHKLCDQSLQELSVVYYRVDADKGFNFSVSDDAFVCQKKNHFQVTCHARLQGEAKFVKTPSGLEKIKAFHLHFYGVKLESPYQTIRVEQSQSDRSKKPFYPVPIDLQSHIVSKITVGRLHFSETTNNNMRKKGRPNPEQRYFQLVVGLHVHTMSGNFPVISQGSERIIVRASNPGQFESDVDLCWQRGLTQDSIFHAGRVGINTDRPDESLVVHGNLKVSGHIVQPSDSRAKQEIGELDTSVQLRNLQKIRIVRYRYEPEFAVHSGLRRASASDNEEIVDTGVIAQEVREVIPDAVQEAGSITLPNGNVIENFLLVNKDRILMENIGAVKELCKVTGHLESRIENLELMNSRLMRKKEYDLEREANRLKDTETCSNRNLQIIIFMLVIIMAACLTAVSTLYFLEHNKQHHNSKRLERLQMAQHPSGSLVHDAQLLSEQERHYQQLRNFLHSNVSKSHGSWPDYFFGLTTTRPPSTARTKSTIGFISARNVTTSGQEIAYNESGEFYSTNGRTDELAVVMEKPLLSLQPLQSLHETQRVTTSAPPPVRSNKTVTSKNKLKWPMPQVVLRAAAANLQQVPSNNGFKHDIIAVAGNIVEITSSATVSGAEFPIAKNVSETVTEKVGAVAIPHDFENNSIDIDARRTTIRKKSNGNKPSLASAPPTTVSPNSASHDTVLEIANDNTDIVLNIQRHHSDDKVPNTSSSNSLNIVDTTAPAYSPKSSADIGNPESSILNVYKTITPTPQTLAITTHRVTENLHDGSTIDVTPLSNKSEGVLESTGESADAQDLQNLSNNSESADNPVAALFGIDLTGRDTVLGGRSAIDHRGPASWIQSKTIEVETFGTPEQCLQQSSRDDISNCQSVCFEGSNQLSPPRHHIRSSPSMDSKNSIPNIEHLPKNVDSSIEDDDVEVEVEPIDDIEEAHKLPIASFIVKKQNATIVVSGKISHATQAIAKQFSSERHGKDKDTLETNANDHSSSDEHFENIAKLKEEKLVVNQDTGISIVANRPPTVNCYKVSSEILSDTLNNTFGSDDFCPKTGRSLNVTYIIPLSRYFKEPGFEMHFSASIPMLWTICRDSEHNKRDGKLLIPTRKGVILPREDNASVMGLTVTSHGYFVRDLELRSSDDLTKDNLCQEQANDGNIFLQYNIRILRDCD